MKVLTVRQPWASQIVAGLKREEFRSWSTSYRGIVAIHASKRGDGSGPTGVIVGVVRVAGCRANTQGEGYIWTLTHPRSVSQPIPMVGNVGLREVPIEILQQVQGQLGVTKECSPQGDRKERRHGA